MKLTSPPEWLQIIIALVITILLTCILWVLVESEKPKPVFRIVAREDYPTLEGTGGFVLEWARNGEMQIPAVFKNAEEREIFERYLSACGSLER